jgi:PhnB protein
VRLDPSGPFVGGDVVPQPTPPADEFAGATESDLQTDRPAQEEPMAFRPYLFFGGNCREAFTRYQEIFGGELTLLTMNDVPGEPPPADKADLIIHAALTIGDDLLMASDDPTTDSFGPVQGMMVSYDAPDVADANRVFTALSDGGKVTQPLEPTFFSEAFGMCVDRFGTPWMIGAPQPQQQA